MYKKLRLGCLLFLCDNEVLKLGSLGPLWITGLYIIYVGLIELPYLIKAFTFKWMLRSEICNSIKYFPLVSFFSDKCISIRFFNKIRKPVKIVSSMKREGYLVTAETFKLKTIFKHARKDRKVHFYAQDLNDKEDVLLNNNNVVTVIPGPCDLPYRSIYLARNGQYSNEGKKSREHNVTADSYEARLVKMRDHGLHIAFGGRQS
jgi:hypothetical protein